MPAPSARLPVVLLLLFAGGASLLPACASSSRVTIPETEGSVFTVPSFDGLAIVYEVMGSGDDVALVFVHGWCCDRSQWNFQMNRFAPLYRVVALDLGGHGDSGRDRELWDLDILAQDVQAVVEDLDLPRVILIGHSMGGPVAAKAAARMPRRVVGVIGVDTLHDAETRMTDEVLEPLIDRLSRDYEATLADMVENAFPADIDRPDLKRRLIADARATPPEVAIGIVRSYAFYDPRQTLQRCPVPIRCINAAFTGVTNTRVNRALARNGYDAIVLTEVGHFIMLEQPQTLDALIQDAVQDMLQGR